MGIDAEMLATLTRETNEEEVLDWAYQLYSLFGRSNAGLWISSPRQPNQYGMVSTHCLSMINEQSWYANRMPTIVFPNMAVKINMLGRFYGVGYERGPLSDYLMIAEWLEDVLPTKAVFYGGDNQDVLPHFGPVERKALWQHFISVRHEPYQRFFGRPWKKNFPPPHLCPLCKKELINCGGGPNKAFYRCLGCRYEVTTLEGGYEIKRLPDGRNPD